MEKPVPTWTIEDVGIWLDDIGLSKFKEHFLSKYFVYCHFTIILL
jgi:hypothetical protein